MLPVLQKIHVFILELLFPVRCLGCREYDDWICEKCFTRITLNAEQVCPVCEKRLTPGGRTCFNCFGKKSLDGLLAVSCYQDKLLSTAVHYYKYRFISELQLPLAKMLLEAFLKNELALPDMIVPVPLHPRRLRWRGFNQAGLLATELGKNLAPGFVIPTLSVLVRKKYTQPQMTIRDFSARQENISGAFAVTDPALIRDANVLLVDDIATTGATIFECAKILKENGARHVFAIVLARQTAKKDA